MTWDDLKRRLSDLSARISGKPDLRWGVVTGTAPLRVRLDADDHPLAGTPSSTIAGLMPDDRVLCLIQSRRVTVIGRGTGPPRSGIITASTETLTQIMTTGMYGTTLEVSVPVLAPPGHTIRITALGVGTGYGQVSQVNQTPGLTSTTVLLRFTRVGVATAQQLTLLWEIVPS